MKRNTGTRIFVFITLLSFMSLFLMLSIFCFERYGSNYKLSPIRQLNFQKEIKIETGLDVDIRSLCQPTRECDFIALLLYQDNIPWRFSCGIESAAIVHPECGICLYHNFFISKEDLSLYSHLKNVKFKQMDVSEMFEGTPLDIFYNGGLINNSIFYNKDVLDTARIALLWKNSGGVYFDMDVVFLRSFSRHFRKDTIFRQEEDENSRHAILNGLQLYYPGSYFLDILARRAVGHFEGRKARWGSMGPELVTRTYMYALPERMSETVYVAPREIAFMLHYNDVEKTLLSVNEMEGKYLYNRLMNECVSVHFWRLMFENHEVKGGGEKGENVGRINEDSVIATIYRENCPVAYKKKMVDIVRRNS